MLSFEELSYKMYINCIGVFNG